MGTIKVYTFKVEPIELHVINLLVPTSTSKDFVEMDTERREYASDTCVRFISDYLMQLGKRLRVYLVQREIRQTDLT